MHGYREASGSPCTYPDWSCVTLKRFSAKARERLSSRQSVQLECSAETIGTGMASVVVAVSENCDLMYGSEV